MKRTFLRMLISMKDFPSKVFNDSNLKLDRMNLYEVFINITFKRFLPYSKKGSVLLISRLKRIYFYHNNFRVIMK
ncbi:hypothetical protein SAMN05443529_1446 [Desulfosporosinus hippei DSM 8344]|uniref:Uncharacterized protein n=1 Tax=Desulfosporosinus hippei DSM 8344 TaxID=1121419 RepID=A0A1G8L2U2_9FIRM|nr:hypothetical protein SAMN05443529_1446 [Desulfosporosinus hippei DSM 8344]